MCIKEDGYCYMYVRGDNPVKGFNGCRLLPFCECAHRSGSQ